MTASHSLSPGKPWPATISKDRAVSLRVVGLKLFRGSFARRDTAEKAILLGLSSIKHISPQIQARDKVATENQKKSKSLRE